MKINNKTALKLSIMPIAVLILVSIFMIPGVMAHCPLCTGATIIGIGITRAWGLDDSLVGIFVGGMIVSSALWINNILIKRGFKGNGFLRGGSLIFITLMLTLVTFYYAGLFGQGNQYRIFGIERIFFGSLSGIAMSLLAFGGSIYIKRKNNGKVLFNYQTMILSMGGLITNALLFWLIFA